MAMGIDHDAQGSTYREIFTCQTSKFSYSSILIIYDLEENFVQIHLRDWQFHLPWAKGQWYVKPRMQGLLMLLWMLYTTSTGPDVGLVQQQASTLRPKTHKPYDVCQHQPWQQAMHARSIDMLPWTLNNAL